VQLDVKQATFPQIQEGQTHESYIFNVMRDMISNTRHPLAHSDQAQPGKVELYIHSHLKGIVSYVKYLQIDLLAAGHSKAQILI